LLNSNSSNLKSIIKYKPGKFLPDEEIAGQNGGNYKYNVPEDKLIFKNYRKNVNFNKS
jgi:hypothetical protein